MKVTVEITDAMIRKAAKVSAQVVVNSMVAAQVRKAMPARIDQIVKEVCEQEPEIRARVVEQIEKSLTGKVAAVTKKFGG